MGQFTNQIQTLYTAYFGRPAEVDGLNYWENYLHVSGSTAVIAAAFAGTAEYQARFAGDAPARIIHEIYIQLFGRAAEPAGLEYWSVGLKNGNFTIANAVMAIAEGAQHADLTALVSKVAGATLFTASLDTAPEIRGYHDPVAQRAAYDYLASITDPASLAIAVQGLDVVVNYMTAPPAPADALAITLVGQPMDIWPT